MGILSAGLVSVRDRGSGRGRPFGRTADSVWLLICLCLGISIGLSFGVIARNLALGLGLGIAFGVLIGYLFDRSKKNAGMK